MEVSKTIRGKKYVFEGITYKEFKELKKISGDDKDALNDLTILHCIKEPKITQEDLDKMDLGEIVEINKAIAKITGLDADAVKVF